jgi:hypothetical protein
LSIVERVEGIAILVNNIELGEGAQPAPARQRLRELREALREADAKARAILAGDLEDPQRDEARAQIRRVHGV